MTTRLRDAVVAAAQLRADMTTDTEAAAYNKPMPSQGRIIVEDPDEKSAVLDALESEISECEEEDLDADEALYLARLVSVYDKLRGSTS